MGGIQVLWRGGGGGGLRGSVADGGAEDGALTGDEVVDVVGAGAHGA